MKPDAVALLTGTIKPHETDGIYKINQTEFARYHQYRTCLKYYLRKSCISQVILAENSRSQYVGALEREFGKERKFELLHCPLLDEREVSGKGYGEGLLIDRAVLAGGVLEGNDSFIKITGRYRIHNISRILSIINSTLKSRNYDFIVPAIEAGNFTIAQTYFFYSKVSFWRDRLQGCYAEVDDKENSALESVVGARLILAAREGATIGILPIAPLTEKTSTHDGRSSMSYREKHRGIVYTALARSLKATPQIIDIWDYL